MAPKRVAGDLYVDIDGQILEIKRQLRQREGYPYDLMQLVEHLQAAIEGNLVDRHGKLPSKAAVHAQKGEENMNVATTDKVTEVLKAIGGFSSKERLGLISKMGLQLTKLHWERLLIETIKDDYRQRAESAGLLTELGGSSAFWRFHEVKLSGRNWFEKCPYCRKRKVYVVKIYASADVNNQRTGWMEERIKEHMRESVCLSCGTRIREKPMW